MPSLVEIDPGVLEKGIFFKFVNVFSLFRKYLPLEKGGAFHLIKLESQSFKNDFCQVWLKFALCSGEEDFYRFLSMNLSLFRHLPLKKDRALHLNKLESSLPKDALCKVWLNLACRFLRKYIQILWMYSCCFVIFPCSKRTKPFIIKKLESPSHIDALCQVWLKLAQWFLRRTS